MTEPSEPRDLARLEAVMLDTYRRELGLELTDPERLRAVYGSSFFDESRAMQLQGICETAVSLLDVTASEINVITDTTQVTVASYGAGKNFGAAMIVNESYCQHVVGSRQPFTVDDSRSHVLVCESVATTEGGIRSYLGVPLINAQGMILGSMCAWSYEPYTWTESHVAMLTSLAAVVMRFEES